MSRPVPLPLFQALGTLFNSFIYCLLSKSQTLFGKLQAFSSLHPLPTECSIHGWLSVDILGQPLMTLNRNISKYPNDTSVDTGSTLQWQWTNFLLMHPSWSTLWQVSTNGWSSVDQGSIIGMSMKNQRRCWWRWTI